MTHPSDPPAGTAQVATAAQEDFLRAMGLHVSSVCVITTRLGDERLGLTATAVSSVCASPPRLLVCVNKSGQTHAGIDQAGHFCVNVLSEDQEAVGRMFAGMSGRDADRFSVGRWHTLTTGAPCLDDAAAVFDCRIVERLDEFSHTIFVGEVLAVESKPPQDPLLYGQRRFRHLRKTYSRASPGDLEMLHL